MKVAIPVDRQKLEKCIREAEEGSNFAGFSALYNRVAATYNVGAEHPIQPQIVGLRIQSWNIPIKTKKGKRGRESQNGNGKPAVVKEENGLPEVKPEVVPPKPKSIYEYPTRSDIEASQSVVACGCHCINIMAPAGDCPAKLSGTDQESVIIWAEKVVEAGHKKGLHFSPSALRYFVRQFYDLETSEHQAVCDCLQFVGYTKLPGEEMPIVVIPPSPKFIPVDEDELEEVETQIKLAAVDLDEIEEEELD